MIEFVLGAILLAVLWLSYTCYFKPKKEYARYSKVLKDLGYKVYELPFRTFKVSFMEELKKGAEQQGDANYYQKNICKNYDLMVSNALNLVTITLISPDLLKQFFSPDKIAIYPKLELMTSGMKQLLGEGIAFSEGTVWKHKRKLISKVFNFDLLKQNIPNISAICDRSLDQMEKENNMKDNEFECYIIELGSRIFTGVMMTCFFGCDLINEKIRGDTLQQFIVKLVVDAYELSFSPLVLALGKTAFNLGLTKTIRDVKERISIFKSISQTIINKRKSEIMQGKTSEKCSDLIQALVEESRKPKNEQQNEYEYTNKDIIEEFSTFLIGGTDTTAHFLMMMVYYLCDYPQIQAKLRRQIDAVIKSDEDITYENLKKLVYIDWLQNQTTRFYGPGTAIFLRKAQKDNFIGNIPITKGTGVTILTMPNHWNEKYYKDPEVFRPERWESECDNIHPFAFVGFSGGPRTCIGKHLAYLESKIALIKLIRRYEKFTIPGGKRVMLIKFMTEPLPFKTKFTKKVEKQ